MNRKGCLLLFLLFTYIVATFGKDYVKGATTYHKSYEYEGPKPIAKRGFLEIFNISLVNYSGGKGSTEAFSRFNTGLEEYFALKLYEKETNETIISSTWNFVNVSDPILLPDVNYDAIALYNAEVFGYPLHKPKIDLVHDGLNSPHQYTISIGAKSDAVIFDGYFATNNASYYFTYILKSTSYQAKLHIIRGYDSPISVKIDLNFGSEDLIHTYDSSYENHALVNELITNKFFTALQSMYLPYLDKLNYKKIKALVAAQDVNYINSYRRIVNEVIINSALQYLMKKRLNTVEVRPLTFTTSVGKKVFAQTYTNIRLHNVLHFHKIELLNSTIEIPENRSEAKLTEIMEFYYPEHAPEQDQTFIQFSVGGVEREIPKKFKIKSVQIIAIYNASLNERPVKVRRNKEVFLNESGFLVKFEIENYDPTYEFLFRHLGNDIARAIEKELVAQGA